MVIARLIAVVALVGAMSGCGATPGPSRTDESAAPGGATLEPLPTDALAAQLGGPWRRAPITLDDSHTAIISDACAAAALTTLGPVEADLPTALIDARGGSVATVILADDLTAILCLVSLDAAGTAAAAKSVARLAAPATGAVDGSHISVSSATVLDDLPGGRSLAFGRVGPDAAAVKLGFDDLLVHTAAMSSGWWSMWWPGAARASAYSAVDPRNLVIGSAPAPVGPVEARVGRASWWLDPRRPAPTATSTSIRALVLELACASGRDPAGRVELPTIESEAASVTITFEIRRLPGGQDCPGNPPFAVTVSLPEPLGARTLLDGSETPPRDASRPPAG